MPKTLRAVQYLNQFFAGLGGEEQADIEPRWIDGAVGPGRLLAELSDDIEIVGTIAAGDNYMAEDIDAGVNACIALIEAYADGSMSAAPDLLIAGPAFNAGRYGIACGAVCQAAQERLQLPAVSALYPDSPAVEIYSRDVALVRTADNVIGMRDALQGIADLARKLVAGTTLIPEVDNTIPRGLRRNYFSEQSGARRAVAMLLAKMSGDQYVTEYAVPSFDRVTPAPALTDARDATIAVVTSGGIVPRGNPDRIEAASASRYGSYSLAGLASLSADTHQSVHGGYDPTYANEDPNRVLPIDVLRDLEREGRIGRLHNRYFATVGNATPVERAARFGAEIAALLVNVGVQAVIFTST